MGQPLRALDQPVRCLPLPEFPAEGFRLRDVEVDNPKSAPLALAVPSVRPAHLLQPTASRDSVPLFRLIEQCPLKLRVDFIGWEVGRQKPGPYLRLNECQPCGEVIILPCRLFVNIDQEFLSYKVSLPQD